MTDPIHDPLGERAERPVFWKNLQTRETWHDWSWRLLRALPSDTFFSRGGGLSFVAGGALYPIATARELAAVLTDFLDARRPSGSSSDVEGIPTAFTEAEAMRFMFSAAARDGLPRIEALVNEPVFFATGDAYSLVSKPGFDAFTGIYYMPRVDDPRFTPREGTAHLERCFSDLPFQDDAHRANFFAWLLGGLVIDRRMECPLLTITAHSQGVGKSSAARAASQILVGHEVQPLPIHGEEFQKTIATRFLQNERMLFMDNLTVRGGGAYDDPKLSALLTSGFSKSLRVLGRNRSVEKSGVLFMATMNECRLSTDLTTRALVVNLDRTDASPMDPYCCTYAAEHRAEIFGELLGLGLRPTGAPITNQDFPFFRFRRWLEFVVPRVVPVFGPLDLSAVSAADPLNEAFFALAPQLLHPFTAPELESFLAERGDLGPLNELMRSSTSHGRVVKLGMFLSRIGRVVLPAGRDGALYQLERTRDRPATYQFRQAGGPQ